jgi:hypothetical protein
MVATAREDGRLTLATSTWISLIALVAGGIATNLGLIYSQSANLQTHLRAQSENLQGRIDTLDEKWQERTVEMAKQLQHDIQRVEDKIPPDWFRSMVERNTQRIDKLEDELHRQ